MRHIIPISGKDSLATALVQNARRPELPYEYLFTDVAAELPETYAWLSRVEQQTGWTIHRVGLDLISLIESYGGYLPNGQARYCTRKCKIEPMEALIGVEPCCVYYGLRADENRVGYIPLGQPNITPVYPLRECSIDLRGVYAILSARGLMPPDFFWPRMYDAVSRSLNGCEGWEESLSQPERIGLFAGRTRANCFMCFFQRQYEFLWLYETHPDLFSRAEAMEKAEYTFQMGFALASLRDPVKRNRIFWRRVKEVSRYIRSKAIRHQRGESWDNELALISCGLLCGK